MYKLLHGDHFPRLFRQMREHPGQWLSWLVLALGPLLSFWMVEILNQNNIFADLQPWQVGMNLIWYTILFALCRLILGRNRRAGALGAILCFAVGLVNHYILRFRGRILFPADLAGWRTAANVADGFDFSMDHYMAEAAILLAAYLFLLWMCPAQRRRRKLPLPLSAAVVLGAACYSFAFFRTDMLPNLGIYTQQWVTQANGFVLNFTVAARYSSVDKPEDYSHDKVMELVDKYPAIPEDPFTTHPVNIIAVMNESFADFSIFDEMSTNEDPTPFLHSMRENTVRGLMYSPVTGGGTASVEFEYLTGFSTVFQPPHTVAYQLYMEENMPSLAALTSSLGYHTTAFHPYKSSGWNRPIAYRDLGFDDQLYDEDVPNPSLVRHYISDLCDYRTVMDRVSARNGEPIFLFNVTMQNHSGYAQGWNNLERVIQLPEQLAGADRGAQQYFNLIRASDDAMREMIEHYSQVEEPTMIIFFGDHQPPLNNEFYEKLYGKPLDQRTTKEVMMQYAVPFFIWANYDIPEREDLVISPNYLGVLTAQLAGLPMTGYMNFLAQLYQVLPAITPVGFLTPEGEALTRDELNEEQKQWLDTYETLNYCGMVDLFDEARGMFCLPESPF